MGKRGPDPNSSENALSLGTQAWNSADGYAKVKILKLLIQLDKYENIALYGSEDIDEMLLDPSFVTERRVEALSRFLTTIRQLIGNVSFAIKKDQRKKINEFLIDIEFVESRLGYVVVGEQNFVTGESFQRVNETHFNNCFKLLRRIKDEMNFPINASGLIFRENDEMDLEKIINDIVEGG